MQPPSTQRKPYPVPDNLKPNRHQARILQTGYSGRNSELTSIAQYIYHHMEIGREYPQLGKTLRNIAIVEMHHLDMLGECLRQLGIQPRYVTHYGNKRSFWNGGMAHYGRTFQEMLKADIDGERAAISQYNWIIRHINEPSIIRLIQRIVEDEHEHVELLQKLITQL